MSEDVKRAVEELSENAVKLKAEEIQRLSDITYGMLLVKEAQPKKEE